jgi:hypothetical protein
MPSILIDSCGGILDGSDQQIQKYQQYIAAEE